MIDHQVLMKLKPGGWRDNPRLRDGLAALLALKGKIPGIDRRESGWNFTDRSIAHDFALESMFVSRAAFDAYGPHPEHQAA